MTDVTNAMPDVAMSRGMVATQIAAWIAAGRPDGEVTVDAQFLRVGIQVPEPSLVAVWAKILRQPMGFSDSQFCVSGCPIALGGWKLRVWCKAPNVSHELLIPCMEVES